MSLVHIIQLQNLGCFGFVWFDSENTGLENWDWPTKSGQRSDKKGHLHSKRRVGGINDLIAFGQPTCKIRPFVVVVLIMRIAIISLQIFH